MRKMCLIPFALALVCSQDPPREPEPSLLDAARGVDRAWGENEADACLERTTRSSSWFVGRDLAVRKGREKLSQLGAERSILTTNVFARRDGKWGLVDAHHSEYEPGG